MTTFIALVRAVNLGGTNKLPMAELTAMCAAGAMSPAAGRGDCGANAVAGVSGRSRRTSSTSTMVALAAAACVFHVAPP